MGDFFTPGLGFVGSAARFIAQLSSVRDETGVVIDQVKMITNDITEAELLFARKKSYLSEAEQSRVEAVIRSTRVAVNRIAKEVEPARKSVAKVGTINGVERFDWVLRRSGSTETYQHCLETCHRSLLDRISMLRGIRPNTGHAPDPVPEPSSTVGRNDSKDQHYFDSDEHDDDDSSDSSILDETHIMADETGSTNGPTHPERVMFEAVQLNHTRKHKIPRSNVHPERMRFEEMQQRYKQRKP